VPWVAGDFVTVVGGNSSGAVVSSEMLSNGSVMLNISSQVQDADEYAWVFKISYSGQNGSNSTSTATGSSNGTAPSTVSMSGAAKALATGACGLLSLGLAMFVLL
jgi:alpha-L-fucosidase